MKTLHGKAARERLKRGIDTLAKAVSVTLGPKGSTVIIQSLYGVPHATKDGVTVAKAIDLDDPVEDMGAQLIKASAVNTVDSVGDGTTTTTVLTQALIEKGMYLIDQGAKPIDVSRAFSAKLPAIEKILNESVTKITDDNIGLLDHVAVISSNNDEKLGGIIAKVYKEVGLDGTVEVVKHDKPNIETEVSDGSMYENGYINPQLLNSGETKIQMEDCKIMIVQGKITKVGLIPLLEYSRDNNLLIICDEMDDESKTLVILNKRDHNLKVAVVTSPGFGDVRRGYLNDISILTGAPILPNIRVAINPDHLFGVCDRVVVSRDTFSLIGAKNSKSTKITSHVGDLKTSIASDDVNDFDKGILQKRIATILGKIALIKVGAATELELLELKDRVDDAVAATSAALQMGIVPGGGNMLAYAANSFKPDSASKETGTDQFNHNVSLAIVEVLRKPMTCILENAGLNSLTKVQFNAGFNALNGDHTDDLIQTGIVDPLKVTLSAVRAAFSIATTVLTTDCLIYKDNYND